MKLRYSICPVLALIMNVAFASRTEAPAKNTCLPEACRVPAKNTCLPAAYNAPASIAPCYSGWDINASASFLFWLASQGNMQVATKTAPWPEGGVYPEYNSSVVNQNTKYTPGFKVALGMDTNYDDWMVRAEYTYLHQTTTNHGSSPIYLSSYWFLYHDFETYPTTFTSKWKMNLDMLDAVCGRPYYSGKSLIISPFAGLKALWIRQRMDQHFAAFLNTSEAISDTLSQCWSLGPTTGATGNWLLGRGFRIEGKAGASLLYAKYTKIAHKDFWHSATATPYNAYSNDNNFSALRPILELGAGLGWGSYLYNHQSYIDFSVRYDFMELWEQNVLNLPIYNLQAPITAANLYLHGLTVTGRFDF